jgi:hypothetical protein
MDPEQFLAGQPAPSSSGLTGVDLKKEINNFIWMYAPSSMTLDKAEALACHIFEAFDGDRT